MQKSHSLLLFAVFAVAVLLMQSAFIVRETEQVLVLKFGKPVAQHTEAGLKLKVPFIHQVKSFDKRVLDIDPPSEQVILADQKRLLVDTFARYRITDMLKFNNTLSTEQQAASRLDNIISSTTRNVLGSASLVDILSEKRNVLMGSVRKQVNTAVQYMGIEIVDVRIGRADLPTQTSQSIFARMRTEREREAAEFRAQGQEEAQTIKSKADKERTVLLAEAEKQAQISRGKGDEIAIKTYAEAFKQDPKFYAFYRSMEAYRAGLSGDSTTMILSPDNDFLEYFKDSGAGN